MRDDFYMYWVVSCFHEWFDKLFNLLQICILYLLIVLLLCYMLGCVSNGSVCATLRMTAIQSCYGLMLSHEHGDTCRVCVTIGMPLTVKPVRSVAIFDRSMSSLLWPVQSQPPHIITDCSYENLIYKEAMSMISFFLNSMRPSSYYW